MNHTTALAFFLAFVAAFNAVFFICRHYRRRISNLNESLGHVEALWHGAQKALTQANSKIETLTVANQQLHFDLAKDAVEIKAYRDSDQRRQGMFHPGR